MRKVLLTTLLAFTCAMVFGQKPKSNSDINHHAKRSVNTGPIYGYLEHLPPGYHNSTKKYPMIVMLHGLGESGNGGSDLYKTAYFGPSKEVEQSGKFCIDGECFIVVSPQLKNGSWTASAQSKFWNYILNQRGLRYDPARVYLTGLSLGGNGVWNWITSDYTGADKIAAAGINCGWGNTNQAYKISQRGTSTWAFHGTADGKISYSTGKDMHNATRNANNPTGAEHRWTAFQNEGHSIWWMTLRMDEQYVKPNLYRWMASKRLGGGTAPPPSPSPSPNNAPTVSAGADVTVAYNDGNHQIQANANDSDGNIVSYKWTKISGPAVSMWKTTSSKLGLSEFASSGGTYEFKVTVTDNDGATASDRVKLVKEIVPGGGGGTSSGSNNAPTVSAGADVVVPYNDGNHQIQASANDSDGSIASYKWTKISGPSVAMWKTTSSKLGLSEFAASGGTYEFKITVTDNDGATASDRVKLVKEVVPGGSSSSGNDAPSVSAGADVVVPYNDGNHQIQANANDPDGNIVSYKWTKVSGPAVSMWKTTSSKLGLSEFAGNGGTYEFKVTVTDNDGATASDYVKLVKEVVPGGTSSTGNQAPTVSAGPDFTIGIYSGSADILATGNDPDGMIVSWKWTKVSGPSVAMWKTDQMKVGLSEFADGGGIYEFKVTVTDGEGATASDIVRVTKLTPLSSFSASSGRSGGGIESNEVASEVIVQNYRSNGGEIAMNYFEDARIIILGINGVMVTDEKIAGSFTSDKLNNGMYIYRLVSEEGQVLQKGRIIKY